MARFESLSSYVEKMTARLRLADRHDQSVILVREIAELRLQMQNMAQSVSALASFCELGARFDAERGELAAPPLPGMVRIDASQGLHLLDGFYDLEHTPQGRAFRWTGPQRRFRFSVWIDRTRPVDVTLHVLFRGHAANATGMRLFVDGRPNPVRFDASREAFIATDVAPEPLRDLSVFEFESASPQPVEDRAETRELGVPFAMFEVAIQDRAASYD